jgi:hypothetical protein
MRLIVGWLILLVSSVAGIGQVGPKASCPSFQVTGPAGILDRGDVGSFTITIENPASYRYLWKVESGGELVGGQGTTLVWASYDPQNWEMLSAWVEVFGLPAGCPNKATASTHFSIDPGPVLIRELTILHARPDRRVLAAFAEELKENPYNQGYVILYFKPKTPSKTIVSVEKMIYKFLNEKLHPDTNRITLVRAYEAPAPLVRLYRVPPGAENPAP